MEISSKKASFASTARRLRSLSREPASRSPRFIIIATENTYIEKQYFEDILDIPAHVKVEILSTEDNNSAPQHVISRLHNFIEIYKEDGSSFGISDEFWLMLDVDRWHKLSEVAEEALQFGYQLAVSKPCFELWLLCHYQAPPSDISSCRSVEDLLGKSLGVKYKKQLKPSDFPYFRKNIGLAVRHAIESDIYPDHILPQNTGTRVYRVVQSILGLNRK